jgi:hypothetical protein
MAYAKNRQETFDSSYKIGEYCSLGFNGDRRPCQIVAISDSGKEMQVRRIDYKVVTRCTEEERKNGISFQGATGPGGEQTELITLPNNETGSTTVKLSKKRGWSNGWQWLSLGLYAAVNPHI